MTDEHISQSLFRVVEAAYELRIGPARREKIERRLTWLEQNPDGLDDMEKLQLRLARIILGMAREG
jgi:hypothetical protein